MQVDGQTEFAGQHQCLDEHGIVHCESLRVRRELAQSDETHLTRTADLRERGLAAGSGVQRGKSGKPIRMRSHAFGIKSVLPRAGLGFFPIPTEQHGPVDAGRVHCHQ